MTLRPNEIHLGDCANPTRLLLIALHQGRISGNVGEHDGSEVPLLFFDHGDVPLGPGGSWIDLRHIQNGSGGLAETDRIVLATIGSREHAYAGPREIRYGIKCT